jgi:hypothetical protein
MAVDQFDKRYIRIDQMKGRISRFSTAIGLG